MQYKIIYAKAFNSDQQKHWHNVTVDPNGVVRVYDDIADAYTTCHSLPANDQKTIAESNEKTIRL